MDRSTLERLATLSAFNSDPTLLPALVEHLEGPISFNPEIPRVDGCDNTLSMSVSFLQPRSGFTILWDLAWLMARGGHCDCEVLLNVADEESRP